MKYLLDTRKDTVFLPINTLILTLFTCRINKMSMEYQGDDHKYSYQRGMKINVINIHYQIYYLFKGSKKKNTIQYHGNTVVFNYY